MATKRKNKQKKGTCLYSYFETLIQKKRQAGKYSAACLYRATNNWLIKSTKGHSPMLCEVTPGFIDNFILFLQSKKHLKTNTIVCYIHNFRAMYNTAVRNRIIHPRIHPFNHLSLHKEETAKRAVSKEVIENICNMDLKEEPELAFSADLCTFSFLACGIPFIDLAHLTTDNIIGNDIVYNRIKTGTLIRIRITEGMEHLLNKYQGQNGSYLFPILMNGKETRHAEYKNILFYYNSDLKEIASRLNIPINLTSYVIRHTWATEAHRQHIPIAVISQALGHTSEKTTRYYLDQLDQSELNDANQMITNSVDSILLKRA